ncbi:MAG TPA: hypothetical protein VFP36_12265 [Usitatibacter sp.]|nr:hypothetical protein [Usitatibacter sp.]
MMGIRAEALQPGRTYFALFHADGRRDQPIVETYVFIGTDEREDEGIAQTEYVFQLARSYYQHGDWNRMTMDERDEYVDAPIVTFDVKSLRAIHDAAALTEELRGIG